MLEMFGKGKEVLSCFILSVKTDMYSWMEEIWEDWRIEMAVSDEPMLVGNLSRD